MKHAVNHHESRLNIESTVGKGTRFSFVIPERLIAKTAINPPLSSFIAISQSMLAYFLTVKIRALDFTTVGDFCSHD